MRQIFALQVDARPAEMIAQALSIGHRGRASGVGLLQMRQTCVKFGIGDRRAIGCGQLVERRDERLWHEAPAEIAEVAARIRDISSEGVNVGFWGCHR